MRMIKQSRLLALAMASTFVMTGCGPDKSQSQAASAFSGVAEAHSIAAAKNGSWPSFEVTDTDLMDSMPNRENIMVVLDMSGSMRDDICSGRFTNKSLAAKSVLRDWVAGLDQEANLGLIVFDSKGPNVHLPLGRDNRDRFVSLVQDARPDGGTPLKTSVALAAEQLEKQAALQQGYGRYKMMVITDGEHSSGEDPSGPLRAILSNPANPIEINTVGFCITDSALNQPGLTNYHSAKNPEELRKGLDSVLAESMDFQPLEEFDDDA